MIRARVAKNLTLTLQHPAFAYSPGCCSLGLTKNPWFDSVLYVGCLSPFTANAWWFSLRGFLLPLEGLKILLILIGTVSQGQGWPG